MPLVGAWVTGRRVVGDQGEALALGGTTSGLRGGFLIPGLAPGRYEVVARYPDPNLGPFESPAIVVTAPVQGVIVDVDAPNGSGDRPMTATIVLKDGPGQEVTEEGTLTLWLGDRRWGVGRHEGSGEYRVKGIVPGFYDVSVDVPGWAVRRFKGVRFEPGPAGTAVDLDLHDASPAVSGQIEFVNGAQPRRLELRIVRRSDDTIVARTRVSRWGDFTVRGLPAGDYRVLVVDLEPSLAPVRLERVVCFTHRPGAVSPVLLVPVGPPPEAP